MMRQWPTSDADLQVAPADDDALPDQPAGAVDTSSGDGFADVPLDADGMPTEDALRTALKVVMDPEIGINVVDLGLVYGLEKSPGTVRVTMTLTSMGCPLTELIHQQCTMVLTRLPGVEQVEVDFTFSPPWSTDMIADDAREELRAMGFNV